MMVYTSLKGIRHQGEDMRSFSNYRKQCIRESLNRFSARGSSKALFDILKLDLLETTNLPELLTENAITKSEFNLFRKDCQSRNKYIVETVCDYAGNNFYDVLLAEADLATNTAVDPAAAFRMLRDETKQQIIDMVAKLKAEITGAVASPTADRDAEDAPEDTSSVGGTGPIGSSPAPQGSGGNAGSGTGPTGSSPAPQGSTGPSSASPAPQGGAPMGGGPQASGGPTVGGAFRDLMGALRPKDGWLGGIKRSIWNPIRDAGRYLKKNWYGENRRLIESMLSEQSDQIGALIDNFQKELLGWFDTRCIEIAKDLGIDLNAAGVPTSQTATPPVPGAPADQQAGTIPGEPQGLRPVGTQPEKQANGTDERVVTGHAQELERQAAAGDPAAKKKINQHYQNLLAGCKEIGFGTGLTSRFATKGKKMETPEVGIGNLEIDGVPASQFEFQVFAHHKPVTNPDGTPKKKAIGGHRTDLIREIVKRIYVKLGGRPTDPDLNVSSGRGDALLNDIWAKLPGGGGDWKSMSDNQLIAALLLRLGAKQTGSAVNAAPEAAPEQTGASPEMTQGQAPGAEGSAPQTPAPSPEAEANPLGVRPTNVDGATSAPVDNAKTDHVANMALAHIKRTANEKPGGGSSQLLAMFQDDEIRNFIKEVVQRESITDFDDASWKVIAGELRKFKENGPQKRPEAAPPQEDPAAPETPQGATVEPEVPQEDPAAQGQPEPDVPQDAPAAPEVVPQEDPAAQDTPFQPEARPAKLSSMADMVRNRKAKKDPSAQLSSYENELESMIQNTDVGPTLVAKLMSAWQELNPAAGDDEFIHLKNQLKQAVSSPDAESAIEGFKKDLLIAKAKQLGLGGGEEQPPVGESYKAKIDRYKKLIKESTVMSTPTKNLREKLGLPA